MAKKIKPEDLEKALADIIDEYADDVISASQDAVETVAQAGVTRLEQEVRRAGIGGNKYVKSFKVKKERGRLGGTAIISSSQYQLTHLLEYGHAKVVYGHRITGKTRAFPHWQQAEQYANDLLEDTIKKAVGGTK